MVLLEDIGENTDALLCVTNYPTCCSSGEFYYPDGSRVPTRSSGQDFYRNRGNQLILLHRRNNAMSPTGTYRCVIQDANGVDQNLFINIGTRVAQNLGICTSWLHTHTDTQTNGTHTYAKSTHIHIITTAIQYLHSFQLLSNNVTYDHSYQFTVCVLSDD